MEIDKMSNIDPNDWKNWEEKEENAREYEAAREFYDDGEFWGEFYGVENY